MIQVSKSLLTNFGLLLLIAGLLWFTQRPPSPASLPPLTLLNTSAIDYIHIKRPHNDIQIEKSNTTGSWELVQPIPARANPSRIQFITDLLDTPVFSQQVAAEEDNINLEQFGLSPPQIQLQLNEHLFEFGSTSPLNKQRYLRYQQHIYLIADRIYPLLLANPSSFIDHQLIAKQQRLITVSWSGLDKQPDGQLSQTEGHWTSSDNTLNADQIGSMLTAWQHAQATGLHILDNPPETTGGVVSLQLEGNTTPIHYSIQLTDKEILLQQHGLRLQYHFPLAIKTELFPAEGISEPDA